MDEKGDVQFDFVTCDPELAVELTLPLAAHPESCRAHAVTYLTLGQGHAFDIVRTKWRFGAPAQKA